MLAIKNKKCSKEITVFVNKLRVKLWGWREHKVRQPQLKKLQWEKTWNLQLATLQKRYLLDIHRSYHSEDVKFKALPWNLNSLNNKKECALRVTSYKGLSRWAVPASTRSPRVFLALSNCKFQKEGKNNVNMRKIQFKTRVRGFRN